MTTQADTVLAVQRTVKAAWIEFRETSTYFFAELEERAQPVPRSHSIAE